MPNVMVTFISGTLKFLILEVMCISYKNVFKCEIRKYFLLKELLTCGSLYHLWLSTHRHLIV